MSVIESVLVAHLLGVLIFGSVLAVWRIHDRGAHPTNVLPPMVADHLPAHWPVWCSGAVLCFMWELVLLSWVPGILLLCTVLLMELYAWIVAEVGFRRFVRRNRYGYDLRWKPTSPAARADTWFSSITLAAIFLGSAAMLRALW